MRIAEFVGDGWRVVARSWAAQLTAARIDADALSDIVRRGRRHGTLRELDGGDVEPVLALDSATLGDYPGGIATQHTPLTRSTAWATPARRGFGAFDEAGRAIAITFVDLDGQHAETDFTVVVRERRGLGLGTAVKAASVLTLRAEGVEVFRTGGSAENSAGLASNLALGYVVDEEWVTLSPS
ncbi:acetyltransferase [Serinicoccus kebangsaanensis]|uniref:acetyltransferase n=1 Tax=Serinicoccus kebangsaanensis TaxID=2602069 RepID=UPI001EE362DD|nr:acetyltransferase [Serinicoccus kebangsaanensis]